MAMVWDQLLLGSLQPPPSALCLSTFLLSRSLSPSLDQLHSTRPTMTLIAFSRSIYQLSHQLASVCKTKCQLDPELSREAKIISQGNQNRTEEMFKGLSNSFFLGSKDPEYRI